MDKGSENGDPCTQGHTASFGTSCRPHGSRWDSRLSLPPPFPLPPKSDGGGASSGLDLWGWNHMSSLLSLQALFSTEDSGIQWEDCHVLGRRWA